MGAHLWRTGRKHEEPLGAENIPYLTMSIALREGYRLHNNVSSLMATELSTKMVRDGKFLCYNHNFKKQIKTDSKHFLKLFQ